MLFLTVAASNTHAQWRIVAPNLTILSQWFGAMCFQNGTVWIASDALYISTDTGITWIKKPLPDEPYDIQFFNSMNGVLSGTSNAWITRNGGTSWQILSQAAASGCFLNDSNSIALACKDASTVGVTLDGGNNWRNIPTQQYKLCVRYKNGTIYQSGGSGDPAYIFFSTDFGLSWQQTKSGFDQDSYSFAIDSCDPNRIYVSHEDGAVRTDQYSKIYLTTDLGTTWQVTASEPEPFFSGSIAEGTTTIYCPSTSNGVYRSTDHGVTWSSIGGPSVTFDTRLIAAINDNILLAVDDAGNVWRTDNSGGDSIATAQNSSASALIIPSRSSILNHTICSTPVDTFLGIGLVGCGIPTGTLDSLWLSGSAAFQLSDPRPTPRTLSTVDSILVRYDGTQGSDTSILHLQYNIGAGIKDTTTQLIGFVSSALAAHSAQLHRESASAYYGQLDSLLLGVDLNSQINIDSLWPHISDIKADYTWDSSVVAYASYMQPTGWLISAINHTDTTAHIEIQNNFSSPMQPLDLGTALFRPSSSQLASSWVQLSSLTLEVGGQAISLCVTDNEDNHWAVKTLGVQSGVTPLTQPLPKGGEELEVFPNPASDELFVKNDDVLPASIAIYDVIGREVASGNVLAGSTGSINIAGLAQGSYVLVGHIGDRVTTFRVNKVQ